MGRVHIFIQNFGYYAKLKCEAGTRKKLEQIGGFAIEKQRGKTGMVNVRFGFHELERFKSFCEDNECEVYQVNFG